GGRSDLSGNLEHERLHCRVLLVLLRFLDFELLGLDGGVRQSIKLFVCVYRSRRGFQRKRIALADHPCEPEVLRPRYGVGDHVEQFLPAGAVALQLLDRRDSLLQDYLLFLEGLDLQLGLLQIRLLRRQSLDFRVFFVELVLPRVIEKSEYQGAENQSRADEYHRQRCSRVYRTPGGLWSNLSKKVYADHG